MDRPDRAEGSRFAQRIRRRYALQLTQLPPGTHPPAMQTLFEELRAPGRTPAPPCAPCASWWSNAWSASIAMTHAPLSTITGAMTALAEFALDTAYVESARLLDLLHGAPATPLRARGPICASSAWASWALANSMSPATLT